MNRDFRLLWTGSALSALGGTASSFAYTLLVLALTGSPSDAGLVGFAAALPHALCTLPAGLVVDRVDRRRLMMLCDIGRALALVTVLVGLALDVVPIWQLVLVAFVEGTLTVHADLAEQAALSNLVPEDDLAVAMSRFVARDRAAYLVGQPLGGVLFAIGRWVPFLFDLLSYLVSFGTLLGIRGSFQQDEPRRRQRWTAELREGAAWLWRRPFLRTTALLIAGSNIAFQALTLVVVVLLQGLGHSSVTIGLVLGCAGAGGTVGSLIASWVNERLRLAHVVMAVSWVWASLVVVLTLSTELVVLGPAIVVIAFVGPIWIVGVEVHRLRSTPDHLQGRVGSVFALVSFGPVPLGSLIAGFLLEERGAPTALVFLAVGLVLLAITATVAPSVREKERIEVQA
ncbi:MFS transporter [Streptomyces sp. NBC_00523]|uniref:MFS transporter n=1 Tax=unclassified Streptomyces TaxID=2593676 RepID=UPI002E80639F|nr:MFS transporter [Streptomyces sp. NBC_00523]WUD01289.1 MFS transporter [Streptomyces sp. NBC_00523]